MKLLKKPLSKFLFALPIFTLIMLVSSVKPFNTVASNATHVVISEVQIAGDVADDEFVELFNPTNQAVDITGWRLSRFTQAGSTPSNLVTNITGTIPAHGYFLIAPSEYDGSVAPDAVYSTSTRLSSNNSLALYSDAGITEIDVVGMGEAVKNESISTISPEANQSIERKAVTQSTQSQMANLGDHANMGNGEDSNHNLNDFLLRLEPQPQNSASSPELLASPSSTPSPMLTPTPTQVPTSSPSPTSMPTPIPTLAPTSMPTPIPTLAPTSSPTPTPTSTPTPTPNPNGEIYIETRIMVCRKQPILFETLFGTIKFYRLSCALK